MAHLASSRLCEVDWETSGKEDTAAGDRVSIGCSVRGLAIVGWTYSSTKTDVEGLGLPVQDAVNSRISRQILLL